MISEVCETGIMREITHLVIPAKAIQGTGLA